MAEKNIQKQSDPEKRIAELAKNLSPEAQGKTICFMEGLKAASIADTRTA